MMSIHVMYSVVMRNISALQEVHGPLFLDCYKILQWCSLENKLLIKELLSDNFVLR